MTGSATSDSQAIGYEQIRLLFAQSKNVMYGGIAVAAVEFAVLWGETEQFWLLLWFACIASISLIRLVFHMLYHRRKPLDKALPRWLAVYLVIIFLVGLSWGSSGLLLMVTPSYLHQSFIVIILGGVAFGGISAHGSLFRAYLAFSLAALLPLAVWQFSYGTSVHSGFGTTILLFTIVLCAAARNYNRAIVASLRLRRENLALAAKAEIANQAKSEFLANMSHEIRTPLTAIIGYAESSFDSNQTMEERLNALRVIKHSGDHLLQIVNNILDFSKIEANKLDVEHVDVNLFQLLNEVEGLMLQQAQKKGLDFHVEYTFPLPATFHGDPVRIRQVLLNLCSNAIKFTERGRVVVSVACARDVQQLYIKVRDSGIGMDTTQCETIFEPFRQADTSITRRFGGTGLGLSLSRRLVELMGGSITVRSQTGAGTEFVVTLPSGPLDGVALIDGMADLDAVESVAAGFGRAMLQGRVLLAEDNKVNQEMLAMFLRKMGAAVDTADDGKDAVAQALATTYDVIYMDMQMPVMSGIDATKALRRQGYTGPVVALTANATHEDRALCMAAGCNDFLTKPVNRDRLYDLTARYLAVAEHVAAPEMAIQSRLLQAEPDLSDLVEKFVLDLPAVLDELRQLSEAQDWPTLRHKVHDLKGMGGTFGYPDLSELAAKLEFQLINQDGQAVDTLLGELDKLVKRICQGLFPAGDNDMQRAV